MPTTPPATIAEYIAASPVQARPHLRRVHEILKSVAPKAQEAIKWGTPFFVEPRFVFAFSAHKAHLNLVLTEAGMKEFSKELADYKTTPKGLLQLPYNKPLPEALIRRIATYLERSVREREDDAFW